MGDGGLLRALGLQISGAVDSDLIGPSTGSTAETTCPADAGWYEVEVISSGAAFAGITAAGLVGSTRFTSATTYPLGSKIRCSRITSVKLSCDSTGHAVIAHRRVLL
jgi:hypothetical protein